MARIHSLFSLLLLFTIGACTSGVDPTDRASSPPSSPASAGSDGPPESTPPPPPRGVHPLDGLDPSLPSADLDRATSMFDDADVVALGETVHSSEGYARARGRIVRYLVEKKGVRAVAFEGPWGPAEATRAYVERCEGTVAGARRGLTFRAWMSRATSELLEWLCQYNKTHASDRVTAFGFDIQDPAFDGSYVRKFFTKAAPAEEIRARALNVCLGAKFETMGQAFADPDEGPVFKGEAELGQGRHEACLTAVADVTSWLDANEAKLVAASSKEELTLAKLATRALRANDGEYFYMLTDSRKSFEARDEGMADAFEVLRSLRAPNQRVAIIAHNDHIMRKRDLVKAPGYEWKSMGTWLGDRLGAKYAPVGLFAYRVELNWDGSKVERLPERKGSDDLEKPLHDLGMPALVVDLADNAILDPKRTYAITDLERGVPSDHFRALLFLEHSPPFENP
jgi:erythromycin esterase